MWALHPKNNDLISEYFFNYIKMPEIRMRLASKMEGATGRLRLPRNVLERLKIPLPPLHEQQKIAAVLSAIQEAKEKTENVIKATKELKKSMMKHLFTYGPVPYPPSSPLNKGGIEGGVPLKETEIGMIPEHWEVVRLGDLCDIKSGGTPSKTKSAYWLGGNIAWIRSEKCQDSFITSPTEYITEEGLKNSSAKILPKDTVLIAMVGATIGKTGYLLIDATTNQNVAGLLPLNVLKLNNLFLFYCLQSQYDEFSKEGGYKIANLSFIKSFRIPLPPFAEQKQIADILSAIDNKIEAEESKKQALDTLFKTLLSLLMTGKIRLKDLEVKNERV